MLFAVLVLLGIGILFFRFPFIRVLLTKFPLWFGLTAKDIYFWFKERKFFVCPSGKIIAFCGLFGKGKTLSMVHYVTRMFRRYNDRKVFVNGRWRIQKINVVSNVDLSIPYTKFTGLKQIVDIAKQKEELDGDDYYFVTLVVGDEFSVQLNSRSFKSNIDALFLNTLLTSRHYAISLFYSSQKFLLVDKLLREVTFWVYDCNKLGRIMVHNIFDAFDLENATNLSLVKPLRRTGWLIMDRDYQAYDTLACVGNLVKSCEEGDMLTTEEILNNIGDPSTDYESVVHQSSKLRRRFKQRKK